MSAPENVAFNPLNSEQTRWIVDGPAMADRGEADGRDGMPPASEHPYYWAGYQQGSLMRRALARDAIIVMAAVHRCPRCDFHQYKHGDKCPRGCDNGPEPARLQNGYFVLYGPYDPGDPPQFQLHQWIRVQITTRGLWVYDFDGDCLNPMFLVQ